MRIYIYYKGGRLEGYWNGLLSKMLVGWVSGVEWMDGYPLDCYDY